MWYELVPKMDQRGSSDSDSNDAAELEQRMAALRIRLLIVRAECLLAHRRGIRVANAYDLLQAYAIEHELSLAEVARRLLAEEVTIDELVD